MESIAQGPLKIIAQFCPEECKLVSRRLRSAQLTYVLNLIEKLERENLDQFPYLKGFSDFTVRQESNGSSLIRYVFEKIVADIKPHVLILFKGSFAKEHVYHLLGSCDTSKKIQKAKQEIDYSLQVLAENLRGFMHNLPIPHNTTADIIGTWFAAEENQEMLNQIRTLSLAGNNLRCLPEEICRLINLEEVNLSNNKLTHLPEFFGNLRKLKMIFLSNNLLTNYPGSMHNLKEVIEFKTSGNPCFSPPDLIRKRRLKCREIMPLMFYLPKILVTIISCAPICSLLYLAYKSGKLPSDDLWWISIMPITTTGVFTNNKYLLISAIALGIFGIFMLYFNESKENPERNLLSATPPI